ncbi:MAG: DUF424 family protein [Candidatus Caldarchaeum sp.]|nr:DUF424 family protein [Candidatus Caldarchaeum sp.]
MGRRTLSGGFDSAEPGRCWVKTHRSKTGEVVVAVCDEFLLGRKLKLSSQFSVEVAESFYKGVLVVDEDLVEYFKFGTIINLLGETAVSTAVRHGYAKRDSIIYIDGVPHLQLFL